MAGQAAKKIAKNAHSKSTYYAGIALIATIFNMAHRFVYMRDFSLLSFSQSLLLTGAAWLSYTMIVSALKLGVGYELWLDLFIINTAVQILSIFTIYAWIIYLTVPGYGIYILGGQLLSWVFSSRHSEISYPEEKKQKMKYVRR
jgi:hypothetical protein